MATFSKGIQVPPVGRRSVLAVVLVVALVVALFFIPEILDIAPPAGGPERVRAPVRQENEEQHASLRRISPLDRIALSVQQDTPVPQRAERSERAAPLVPGATGQGQRLQDPVMRGILERARRDGQLLLRELDRSKVASQIALSNFLNGVQLVLRNRNPKELSEENAIRYISQLHSEVSRAMLADRVSRSAYLTWRKDISLFPLLEENNPALVPRIPFQPRMLLTDVTVNVNRRGNSFVRAMGEVQGGDVAKVMILRNGILLREIPFPRKGAETPRKFGFAHNDANGTFTLRVLDKFGSSQEKSYRFLSRGHLIYRTRVRGPDPRFDAWYRISD